MKMNNSAYREIMINSFVEKQTQNYIEEGWPTDQMDPTFRGNHILNPLRALLNITDEEEDQVIEHIEQLLEKEEEK
jgi:hypothetical protein